MPSARLSAAMHNKNDCVKNLAGLVPGIGYGLWRARVSRGVNYAPLSMWGKPNANTKYPQKQKVIRWRGARGTSNVPVVTRVLVPDFPHEASQEHRDEFNAFDTNGNGLISQSEYVLDNHWINKTIEDEGVRNEITQQMSEDFPVMLEIADKDGDGYLNKVEWHSVLEGRMFFER